MKTSVMAQQQSKTFILVHAQWHGAWCWNKLIPQLEMRGRRSVAFDLPGLGNDTANVSEVTYEQCLQRVMSVANTENGPVILVGHSSSGVLIASAAEALGKEKVAALAFLDAFAPNNGESVFALSAKFAANGAPLGRNLIVSPDQKTVALNLDAVNELLYGDCSSADIKFAKSHLKPGPVVLLAAAPELSAEIYDAIPKYYILCTEAQDMDKSKLCLNVKMEKVFKLNSSHSPFLSMPEQLADTLCEIS